MEAQTNYQSEKMEQTEPIGLSALTDPIHVLETILGGESDESLSALDKAVIAENKKRKTQNSHA